MNQEKLMQILLSPHVTNKAYNLADKFLFSVFKVATYATKKEIKESVQSLFEVKVKAVKTLNVKGKSGRFGRSRTNGKTKNWKKAYVRLEDGYDISFVDSK